MPYGHCSWSLSVSWHVLSSSSPLFFSPNAIQVSSLTIIPSSVFCSRAWRNGWIILILLLIHEFYLHLCLLLSLVAFLFVVDFFFPSPEWLFFLNFYLFLISSGSSPLITEDPIPQESDLKKQTPLTNPFCYFCYNNVCYSDKDSILKV